MILLGCEKNSEKANENILREEGLTQEVKDIESEKSILLPIKQLPENVIQQFTTVEWDALIPAEDLAAISNPPDYILQLVDGSIDDQIGNSIKSAMNQDSQAVEVYEQALISTNIIEEMNGKKLRIPGFVVPLEFKSEKVATSFFIVPYFGACLHMPPPPPNQIIYVESEQGVLIESLYDPVWVSGTISTELFEDQLATAAYTMTLSYLEPYVEE